VILSSIALRSPASLPFPRPPPRTGRTVAHDRPEPALPGGSATHL